MEEKKWKQIKLMRIVCKPSKNHLEKLIIEERENMKRYRQSKKLSKALIKLFISDIRRIDKDSNYKL